MLGSSDAPGGEAVEDGCEHVFGQERFAAEAAGDLGEDGLGVGEGVGSRDVDALGEELGPVGGAVGEEVEAVAVAEGAGEGDVLVGGELPDALTADGSPRTSSAIRSSVST